MSDQPVLEIETVGVAYAGRPVLRDVDLGVTGGQVVALLGSNGSGKSTLVKAATGLVPLTGGTVRLFGTPLASFHDWQRIGYVPQRVSAGTGVPATVWEVVASGRLGRRPLFRRLSKHDRAEITDAIATVGLEEKIGQPVSTLSGGQQQRVLMARALAGEPDLVFLDEPNAGVDHESQQRIADALAARAAAGATLVVVLHELGPLEPLIDRAVLLREGRVRFDGPPAALRGHLAADPHGHHHPHEHETGRRVADHVPHVAAPLDRGR